MQIVIDKENLIKMFAIVLYAISGGSYDNAKDTVTELLEEIGYASLPKGHGRLIDANALICEDETCIELTKNAPTIIEADKAESEEV